MRSAIARGVVLALGLTLCAASFAAAGQEFSARSEAFFQQGGQSATTPSFPGQGGDWGRGSGQLPGRPSSSSSRASGQQVMIRIEVTITDQVGTGTPAKKTVTLMAQDDNRAIVRTENRSKVGEHGAPGPSLNVEARPTLGADGKIHLELSVLYDLPDASGDASPAKTDDQWVTRVQGGYGLLLENDKPITVSQSADPRNARKVTVEAKATVVK